MTGILFLEVRVLGIQVVYYLILNGVKMLTDQEIQRAIDTMSKNPNNLHEHLGCVRIAYAWLDAQKKIQSICRQSYPLKHFIEKWAGRYVSIIFTLILFS